MPRACVSFVGGLTLLLASCADSGNRAAESREVGSGAVRSEFNEKDRTPAHVRVGNDEREFDQAFVDQLTKEAAIDLQHREESRVTLGYGDYVELESAAQSTQRLRHAVRRITGEKDFRDGVEMVLRYALDAVDMPMKEDGKHRQLSEEENTARRNRWKFVDHVASIALVQAADERIREHVSGISRGAAGARSRVARYLRVIDAYQDERACKLLLHYALQPPLKPGRRLAYATFGGDRRPYWALVFLRGYDSALVRPRIEEVIRKVDDRIPKLSESLAKHEIGWGDLDQQTGDAVKWYDALQCLVRSLDFADTLSPEDREAYHYFERSLWHSEAVLPRGTTIAYLGSPDWKAGDERFVIFLLETGPPTGFSASWTRRGLPSEVRARLLEIAEGGGLSESVREMIKNKIAPPD